ncbi:polyprenyl synthetase family protein [Streptomyces sp. NPDC058374]|uniref:polyprenyl synthetase family protein n=1 Tax=unclassified Streptomyces TaxID=2593676 RepID=UPI00364A01FD
MASLSTVQDGGVDDVLDRCRRLVRPALRSVVDQLHPRTGLMVRYSFGWCGAEGIPYPRGSSGAGKGVRQVLAVLAAEAVGGCARDAVPGAVTAELVHAFSLVHDDVMDHDELRRHRPTVWKTYGTGPAVLTGDVLLTLAVDTAAHSTGPHSPQALRLLSDCLRALMDGQTEDLAFEERPWRGPDAVTAAQYRSMVVNKTGALLGFSAAVGALLAGGTPQQVRSFDAVGRELGLAFQITDDALGVWGDPARTGKPVGSDLRRRKKSLPVIRALERGGGHARRLAELLESEGSLDDERVRRAIDLLGDAGGPALVLDESRAALERAQAALASLSPAPGAEAELRALARYLVERVR